MSAELPDHVRQMIHRDGEVDFTPPSFERWLGRLQMARILASMTAFLVVWFASYAAGFGWDGATIRAIIAAVVFHYFAWAMGLFVFGELYDAEVKQARHDLEERERERARRIEDYYRERLRAQQTELGGDDVRPVEGGSVPAIGDAPITPRSAIATTPLQAPTGQRQAA